MTSDPPRRAGYVTSDERGLKEMLLEFSKVWRHATSRLKHRNSYSQIKDRKSFNAGWAGVGLVKTGYYYEEANQNFSNCGRGSLSPCRFDAG